MEVQRSCSELQNPYSTLLIITLCLCYTKLLFSRLMQHDQDNDIPVFDVLHTGRERPRYGRQEWHGLRHSGSRGQESQHCPEHCTGDCIYLCGAFFQLTVLSWSRKTIWMKTTLKGKNLQNTELYQTTFTVSIVVEKCVDDVGVLRKSYQVLEYLNIPDPFSYSALQAHMNIIQSP